MRARQLLVLFLCGLLAGASCRPVYSDRPLGDKASALPLNGIWCSSLLSALNSEWNTNEVAVKPYCWTVTALDADRGMYAVLSLNATSKTKEARKLFVRECDGSTNDYFFIFEEDPALAGSYLWALVSISFSPFDAAPILFVWYTDKKLSAFEALVADGSLPGRKLVEPRRGSSLIGGDTEQTLILEELTEKHCTMIAKRRGELFDLMPSDTLHRLGTFEFREIEESDRTNSK